MLIYKNTISKKGNEIKALYFKFKSGKTYRLTIPYGIMIKIIEAYDIPCEDNNA